MRAAGTGLAPRGTRHVLAALVIAVITRAARERPRQGLTLDLPSTAAPPALVH